MLRAVRILLTNIGVFVAIILLLELAARGFAQARGGSFFRPDNFISPWFAAYDYPPPRVANDGLAFFRHRESPTQPAKPKDGLRLIAVGGSTTANERPFRAAGVDYPLALEKRLAQWLPATAVEVLNAGADAFSTAHSLVNIQLRLVEFQPDFILVMHNINDSSVNLFREGATADYGNKYMRPYYLNPSLQGSLSMGGFLAQSRLLSYLGVPQMLASREGEMSQGNDHGPGLKLFERNLAAIIGACRQHNIEPVFLSQPRQPVSDSEVTVTVFDAYDAAIERVAESQGAYFIDMRTKFGVDPTHFVDEFHYSPAGIERFAELLFEELTPVIQETLDGDGSD